MRIVWNVHGWPFQVEPDYAQGNGQAEAAKDISWIIYEEPKRWVDSISLVLWTFRTSKHTLTQGTPFSFVYGAETMVPIDIMVPSACLGLAILAIACMT